jgi:hypothetical protein
VITFTEEYEGCVLPGAVISLDGDPKLWPIEERPVAYLAGFYSANPAHGLANTADWFRQLTDSGWVVLVPHVGLMLDVLYPQPPSAWCAYDKALLRRCDAMFVIDDPLTKESSGVRDEIRFAVKNDIPVFYEVVEAKDRYANG